MVAGSHTQRSGARVQAKAPRRRRERSPYRRILKAAVTAILPLAIASAPAQAAPRYTITDLGSLGGTLSSGTGINNSGQVTGYSYNTGNHASRAFLYSGGAMHDIGQLYLGNTEDTGGFGINSSGQITGYDIDEGSGRRAFLYGGGAMQNLGTLGTNALRATGYSSWGQGINDSGQVTGYSTASHNGPQHAFLYDGASMQDLGTLGGIDSYGYGINAGGQVTGNAALTGNSATHAFLYDGASMQDLGTLGGNDSFGRAINASGRIAGFADTTGDSAVHAFLYSGSSMHDLGTLGGNDSYAYGINTKGQIVGWSDIVGPNLYSAFLYSGGTMYDLNDLISPSDPLYGLLHFKSAAGINDSGQIVADAGNRTFLLTPEARGGTVPEPSTWAMLVTGFLGLGMALRRRTGLQAAMRPRVPL